MLASAWEARTEKVVFMWHCVCPAVCPSNQPHACLHQRLSLTIPLLAHQASGTRTSLSLRSKAKASHNMFESDSAGEDGDGDGNAHDGAGDTTIIVKMDSSRDVLFGSGAVQPHDAAPGTATTARAAGALPVRGGTPQEDTASLGPSREQTHTAKASGTQITKPQARISSPTQQQQQQQQTNPPSSVSLVSTDSMVSGSGTGARRRSSIVERTPSRMEAREEDPFQAEVANNPGLAKLLADD